MIKELRKMRKAEQRAIALAKKRGEKPKVKRLSERLYILMEQGKLKRIINEQGYICYDTEEYKEYKRKVKRGRKPKNMNTDKRL